MKIMWAAHSNQGAVLAEFLMLLPLMLFLIGALVESAEIHQTRSRTYATAIECAEAIRALPSSMTSTVATSILTEVAKHRSALLLSAKERGNSELKVQRRRNRLSLTLSLLHKSYLPPLLGFGSRKISTTIQVEEL